MSFLALMTLACVGLLFFISFKMGTMRAKHDVPAGSVEGPEEFNRFTRSQANLIEGLMMFLPSVWVFGYFGSATLAGLLAVAFLGGRILYHRAYVTDPATRGLPFMVGIGSTALAWVGALVSIGLHALKH
jgi:uncharacterized MAPEG superfamily protein